MTTYAMLRLDAPNVAALRAANRDAHMAHLAAAQMDIKLGGLLLDEEDKVVGSLLVVEADSVGQVEAFSQNDPMTRAGVFAQVTIRRWRVAIGALG